MKKQYLTIAIIGAAILALAYGSFANAQTPDPYPYGMMGESGSYGDDMMGTGQSMMDAGEFDHRMTGGGMMTEGAYGPGMMDAGEFDHGMMGGGMGMMGNHGAMGALHEYMFPAIAEALGLTPQEFQARHDAGEIFWDIAEAQGLDEEEAWELMEEAREEAFEQAVEDGVITEDLAEEMLDHMEDHHEDGEGHGGGRCDEQGPDGLEL